MAQVNVHEAKTHFSKLLERVQAGEEIVIAKGGKPVARLLPLAEQPRRKPGLLAGKLDRRFFDPLPEAELKGWER